MRTWEREATKEKRAIFSKHKNKNLVSVS